MTHDPSTPTAAVEAPKATERKSVRGVLCSKCEHLNAADSKQCRYCQEPLFVDCRHCGRSNQRVLSTCSHCRRPLHGRSKRRSRSGRSRALTRFEKLLLISGSVLFLVAATWYATVR